MQGQRQDLSGRTVEIEVAAVGPVVERDQGRQQAARPGLQPRLRQRRAQPRPEARVVDERPAHRLHVGGQRVCGRQARGHDRQLVRAGREARLGQETRPLRERRQRIALQGGRRQGRSRLELRCEGEEPADPLGHPRQRERRRPDGALDKGRQRRAQLLAGEQTRGLAIGARQPTKVLVQILEQDDPPGGRDRLRQGAIVGRRARPVEVHVEHDHRGAGGDQAVDQTGVDRARPAADRLGHAELFRRLPVQADHRGLGRRLEGAADREQPAQPEPLLDRRAERRHREQGPEPAGHHADRASLSQPHRGFDPIGRAGWCWSPQRQAPRLPAGIGDPAKPRQSFTPARW